MLWKLGWCITDTFIVNTVILIVLQGYFICAEGDVPNPTYKSTTTLVSTNNEQQNFNPYDVPDYSRDVPNPLYASSGTTTTLPFNGTVQGKTVSSSEDLKRHSAVALNTNSAHFTRQYDDNVYTHDPTVDEEDITKDSMYSEVVDDMKRAAPPEPQPVENVYDYIPGDMDPSVVYEKLPPQMPLWLNLDAQWFFLTHTLLQELLINFYRH